ncbi:GIY-YIG nuclease family protein [Salmonella enterica]|nr:GIY-YIG nuclease family protein [Salmonella enterica]
MIGSVYKITNLINQKAYIGITTRDPIDRWWEHCNSAQNGSEYFVHQAIRKYGEESFSVQVLVQTWSPENLKELEIQLIKDHSTHMSEKGYNKTWGGDGATFIGKTGAVDTKTGQRLGLVDCDDPRWASGEITHCKVGVERSFSKSLSDYAKTRVGDRNSNAKKFKLISPSGEEHFIHGNCREYVETLGLKYSALYDYIDKGVPVPPTSIYHKKTATNERLNTTGWQLNRIV